jgi:glycosyltransferase involved in cell wall biosynthesis
MKIASIVIPAYNSTNTLQYTLPSILAQDWSLIREAIVVDSSDNGEMSAFIAKYRESGIGFINSGRRVMPAVQRNIGARASSGELLVFLDSDVILEPDYVSKVVGYFRTGHSAGFGAIDIPDFQANKALPLAQYYLQLNEYLPRGGIRMMPFVSGCNNFCSREIFDAIGGYPEVRASEDVLFGIKVRERTPIWFFPDVHVAHVFREEWPGFKRNQELLGKYVAKYRTEASRSIAFRKPFPYLLYPAFLGAKLLRIVPRILVAGPGHALRLLRVFAIFFVGLCYWTNGFVKEATDRS